MSSVFHSTVNDVVPWQSHYSFPSMATKAHKQTVKLRPNKGGVYKENETVEIDFPSDGYMNCLNSLLAFDLEITPNAFQGVIILESYPADGSFVVTLNATTNTYNGTNIATIENYMEGYVLKVKTAENRFTIHTVLKHNADRTLELSRPIYNYGEGVAFPPVRLPPGGAHELFKRVKTSYGSLVIEDCQRYDEITRAMFDTGVSENYLYSVGTILEGTSATRGLESSHNCYAGYNDVLSGHEAAVLAMADHPGQVAPFNKPYRKRMCVNLLVGSLTLKKLLPLKWMAAQFRLHIELNSNAKGLLRSGNLTVMSAAGGSAPSFTIDKVNYIAELMDFDSTYDTAFYSGLRSAGVPLKFSGVHYHSYSLTGKTHHLSVHERARAVKWAIAVISTDSPVATEDCNAFSIAPEYVASKWTRASAIVDTAANGHIEEYQWRIGGKYYPAQPVDCRDGAAEAYIELLKLNGALGDYTFNTNMGNGDWGNPMTSSKFIIACKFENDDVFPDTMSGINAEEQSDLSLTFTSSTEFGTGALRKRCDIFIGYDSLIIVKEGNNVELVL